MATGGDDDERRQGGRDKARLRVRFRSLDDLVARYTSDVSRGGIFISTPNLLPLGTLVDLALELPDSTQPAILEARVAYVVDVQRAKELGRPPGMGMAFDGNVEEVGERIASYLAQSATAVPEPSAPEVVTLNILIVDDSPTYRASLEEVLVAAGHRVMLADNGLSALGIAVRDVPDVVLTDVNMPMMDGWQLVRVLRSRPATREVPILFLTTLDTERDRIRAYSIGIDDYVEKPFDGASLVARLLRVVARARGERRVEAATALRGEIGEVSVASLLAFFESERRSGIITLTGPSGSIAIHVSRGMVQRVDLPKHQPTGLLDRLFIALDVSEGRFDVMQTEPVPSTSTRETSATGVAIQQALLEHARRADEARAAKDG